jgi:hypothetical protein
MTLLEQELPAAWSQDVKPVISTFGETLLDISMGVAVNPPEVDFRSRNKLALQAMKPLPIVDDQIVERGFS